MKKSARWFTTFFALTMFVAACGGSDDAATGAETEGSNPEVDAGASGGSTSDEDGGDSTGGENTDDDNTDAGGGADSGAGGESVVCGPGAVTAPAGTYVAFYAQCVELNDMDLFPVFRADPGYQPSASARLEQRLEALVLGVTSEERSSGLGVGFDQERDADLIDVVAGVGTDGIASVEFVVDGEAWDPGALASTSAQLMSFLDPLVATTLADAEITGIDLNGLCWGELGCEAGVVDRTDWETQLFTNYGVLSHEFCDLTEAWLRPDDCTVDGQLAEELTAGRVFDVADDDTLNLRAGPGVDFVEVAELPPDSPIRAAAAVALAEDGGRWGLVEGDAGNGWANLAFVSLERSDDESLIDAFITFAVNRNRTNFDELPLADEVQLGLGPDLQVTFAADELRNANRWTLDVESFRAYEGPFSALDVLAQMSIYQVARGPHDHCAGDPMPAPAGFDDADRISVQPDEQTITSCLEWDTVDFFLNGAGQVEAITLDLWEP